MRTRASRCMVLIAFGAFGCENSDLVADRFREPASGGRADELADSGVGSGGATGGSSGGSAAGTGGNGGIDSGTTPEGAGGSDGGGAAGSGGTGLDGGDAGGSPSPNCDDGNPCTTDSSSGSVCRHDAVPDGQRCEDGNFCTLGDRCLNGVCGAGPRKTGAAHALGRVEAYGSGADSGGYSGSVVTPGDDRFVFVDEPEYSPRLTQTRVVGGSLQTLDTLDILSLRSIDPPVATAWGDLVAVASDTASTQVGGDPRLLQVVSVSAAGKLTARGTAPMGGDAITSMIGRGSRLLVCTNFSFFTPPVGTLHWIDVANPDAPVEIASGSLGNQCGSLAFSEDGNRAYVNTETGVRFTDLSAWAGSGPLTFTTDPLVSVDAGLSLRGDKLLARTGDQIHLFNETTHAELSSFSVPGAHAAAFTDAGIFVEGDRPAGAGSEYFVALYTQSGTLLQERIVARYAYLSHITASKPAVGAKYVADTLDQQIFEITSSGFQPINTPEVGGLFYVFAGQNQVLARSHTSTQRIDVADPTHPSIVAGGPNRNTLFGIKLDESPSPAALLSEFDPNSVPTFSASMVRIRSGAGHANTVDIESVTVDADEHHVHKGSIQLPGGDAFLLSAGDFLYRGEHSATGGAHIQRWLESALRAGITKPATDLDLPAPLAATYFAFDVDPSARMAVMLADASAQWLDLSTDPPTPTETPLAGRQVKVRGHSLAATVGSGVAFMDLGSTEAQTLPPSVFHDAIIWDILAFDGNVAYLSSSIPGQNGILGGPAVQVVRRGVPDDQALVAEIRMPALPTSLVAMDGSLVVGSAVEVLTLAPECE